MKLSISNTNVELVYASVRAYREKQRNEKEIQERVLQHIRDEDRINWLEMVSIG